MLISRLDFIGDALVLLPDGGSLRIVGLGQGVLELGMSHFLLLFGHLESPKVLFELTLVNTVLVFRVLKGDLGLFLQLSELVEVLESKMLQPLFVNLDGDLVLLFEILEFSLFVPELGLLVLKLLLANEPEVVNS